MAQDISERAQSLLKKLVESYIREGQPVGSRALARNSGLDLSPATIRNVMADLEDLGLIVSPHTSSGRIPTTKGYRVFVDSLLTIKPVENLDVERLRQELGGKDTVEHLIDSVSLFLSSITKMAGVVMIPKPEHASLRHVEFLALADGRVLAILVLNEREVQNRIINLPRRYTESELREIANYLNAHFAGRDIISVRQTLISEMRDTQANMNALMQATITMADQLFRQEAPADYVMAGETNLMEFQELSDVEKLRRLFEAFNAKREILNLFDQCLTAQGVQIFIGEESGYSALDECSLITSPYEADGKVLGVLGVIGPTRMAYERIIPIVDVTAKMLSAILNERV